VDDLRKLISEMLREEYQSHTFEPVVGDLVVNDNPKCKHRGSLGQVLSIQALPEDQGKTATYRCMNSGPSWESGDVLTKTLDQLVPAVSKDFAYHIDNGLKMTECVYRPGSKAFFDLVREFRTLAIRRAYSPSRSESYYLFETDLGEYGVYEGKSVPLDWPMPSEDLFEAEYKGREVDLNDPMRSSGPKKYKVYTKNDKGNVIQVNFGDAKGGLSAKMDDDDARANFASRHNCDSKAKEDKTKPGYWSCRLPRYWKQLGFKKNSYRFW
jgi:hypothetical protein